MGSGASRGSRSGSTQDLTSPRKKSWWSRKSNPTAAPSVASPDESNQFSPVLGPLPLPQPLIPNDNFREEQMKAGEWLSGKMVRELELSSTMESTTNPLAFRQKFPGLLPSSPESVGISNDSSPRRGRFPRSASTTTSPSISSPQEFSNNPSPRTAGLRKRQTSSVLDEPFRTSPLSPVPSEQFRLDNNESPGIKAAKSPPRKKRVPPALRPLPPSCPKKSPVRDPRVSDLPGVKGSPIRVHAQNLPGAVADSPSPSPSQEGEPRLGIGLIGSPLVLGTPRGLLDTPIGAEHLKMFGRGGKTAGHCGASSMMPMAVSLSSELWGNSSKDPSSEIGTPFLGTPFQMGAPAFNISTPLRPFPPPRNRSHSKLWRRTSTASGRQVSH
eukprot:Hpha_TRINITY_DN11458_c0_g1::TRINITY_DN11458_c0_g1_i1::g.137484::m.137484